MARKEEELKTRLAAVLRDLQTEGTKDPEALFFIGSLAVSLIDKTKARSWPAFKEKLSTAEYDLLLRDFQTQGKKLHNAGEGKKAYAIQALAISLVCRTQRNDFQMREGEALLDRLIAGAVASYRKALRPN
jgi:hypothetical protein